MRKITAMLVALLLCTTLSINLAPAQKLEHVKMADFKTASPASRPDKSKQIPKFISHLDLLYKPYLQNRDYKAYACQIQLRFIEDRLVVTILPTSGQTTYRIDEGMLFQCENEIQAKTKHSMRIAIPIDQLENVVRNVSGIGSIKKMIQPLADSIKAQGFNS